MQQHVSSDMPCSAADLTAYSAHSAEQVGLEESRLCAVSNANPMSNMMAPDTQTPITKHDAGGEGIIPAACTRPRSRLGKPPASGARAAKANTPAKTGPNSAANVCSSPTLAHVWLERRTFDFVTSRKMFSLLQRYNSHELCSSRRLFTDG